MTTDSSRRGKRGRPAQLSRAAIVAAALELLHSEPAEPLTMQRIAVKLKTGTMSLYTHVSDRDDLLRAIAEAVLSGVVMPTVDEEPLQQVADWARALRKQLLRYPQVLYLLREQGQVPAAWMQIMSPLIQALSQAGLKGRALADTSRWITWSVVGHIIIEAPTQGVARAIDDKALMPILAAAARGPMQQVMPYFINTDYEAVFDYFVQRLLDAVTAQLERPASSRNRSPRRR